MMAYHYAWLIWASAFLAPWLILYLAAASLRQKMWWASLFTAPFGLTEPLFVPEYWNPPSLFELARRTGFDIESIIFTFAIGGIGAVLYNIILRGRLKPVDAMERHHRRHRFHRLALATPLVSFPLLYFLPWNPIYPAIAAMALGALAAVLCRPDLTLNTLVGSCFSRSTRCFCWDSSGRRRAISNRSGISGR